MSDFEALLFAICIMPGVTSLVCIFACELRIQAKENDTRRYPRYGKSDQMRIKGKSRINGRDEDNET